MAIFLHRKEEKISRQRQLETNPARVVHFCWVNRSLSVGHRAVFEGKPREVFATGFVISKTRVCKPEEVTQEEFSLLSGRILTWKKLSILRKREGAL